MNKRLWSSLFEVALHISLIKTKSCVYFPELKETAIKAPTRSLFILRGDTLF